jgi:hypothetical protein
MGLPARTGLILLAALAGCSVTSTAPTTTLAPLAAPGATTTTSMAAVVTTELSGYVNKVYDGQSFDLQVGQQVFRFALEHIKVPDLSTCEGTEARALLASIIAGKPVRLDAAGTVWMTDIDVAKAMVQYGRANASDTTYVSEDMASVDFDCASTTTTTIQVIVLPRPTQRERPTTTPPEDTAPGETDPAETQPQETAPPPARPEPPQDTDPPRETKPPKTDPEPEPVVTDSPDRTPKPPKTPDLPGDG